MCGTPLNYLTTLVEIRCTNCGRIDTGYVICPQGHYLCDDCHGQELFEQILNIAETIKANNPLTIAEKLLSELPLPMLGCEHAWLTAAAFMTALKNEGTMPVTKDHVIETVSRTKKQAIGAFCGLTGVCGIAIAIGSSFSVLTEAGCPKDRETALTMRVVAATVGAIASQTGPCCCKNFLRTALVLASDLVKEYFQVYLPYNSTDIICKDSHRHPHGCRREKCQFYQLNR